MKNVYNTGKVLIGSAYEKPFRWEPSADALKLQRALIEDPMPNEDKTVIGICAIAAVLIALMAIAGWLK